MKYIMAAGSNVNNTGTFLARPSATDTQTNVRRTNKMGKSLDRRRFSFTFEKMAEAEVMGLKKLIVIASH